VTSRRMETWIGVAVVAGGLLFLGHAYVSKGEKNLEGYDVTAVFDKADGIGVGSAVRLSGLQVGRVVAQQLDPNFHAAVTLRLRQGLDLPTDTAAQILTDGLLGAKYISLQPGGADQTIKAGGHIDYTQGSVVITELLSKIIDQAKAQRGLPLDKPTH